MLRAIVIAGFIFGVILVVAAGTGLLTPFENRHQAEETKPACDLLASPCEWHTDSGQWRASLEVTGDQGQGTEYQLILSTPNAPGRLLAVLRGESMYMGEYPVPMRQQEGGVHSARFTAPLCTTGSEMVWRIDLQNGQQKLPEEVPLKLIFRARNG